MYAYTVHICNYNKHGATDFDPWVMGQEFLTHDPRVRVSLFLVTLPDPWVMGQDFVGQHDSHVFSDFVFSFFVRHEQRFPTTSGVDLHDRTTDISERTYRHAFISVK